MYLLANAISAIKNNILAKRDFVDVPNTKLIQKCLYILLSHGFILGFSSKCDKFIRIFLKYYKGKSIINEIKCISLPGFRKFTTYDELFNKFDTNTLVLLSTSYGIISNFELLSFNKKDNLIGVSDSIKSSVESIYKKSQSFTNLNSLISFNYMLIKLLNFNLKVVNFHKEATLKSVYRKKSVIFKLSKKRIFANKIFHYYLNQKKFLDNSNSKSKDFFFLNSLNKSTQFVSNSQYLNLLLKLKNVYSFNFRIFFKSNSYLKFINNLNFFNFIKQSNQNHLFSIFYFIYHIKQFNFSRYKYRFSLFLKYYNHLISVNYNLLHKKSFKFLNLKKKKMGGELLFFVR